MRATVDRDECIACGVCSSICPEVFEPDEDDIAVVIADPIPEDVEDEAKEAEESCPTDAITIEE